MEKYTILIGGDISPTNNDSEYFKNGNTSILFDKLEKKLKKSDLNIINLECPLIEEPNPIDKIGPNLSANTECIKALKLSNIHVANLGNNHIMDHGYNGIISTINTLKKNKINFVGIGENSSKAIEILIKKINKINIGILSVAEDGLYTSNKNNIGTASMDVIDIYKAINKNKDKIDYLIALIHGGVEHYPYPSPKSQKLSRFLIENGVDCVVWQHSHCAGYVEKYKKKYIFYGQGNFIFDYEKMHADWYKGFVIEISLKIDSKRTICSKTNIIPFVQSYNKPGIYVIEGEKKEKFIKEIYSKQKYLKDEDFVIKKWNEFCNEQKEWYLSELLGYERLLKIKNKIKNDESMNNKLLRKYGFNKEEILKLNNLIFNESHNEMIKSSLKLYIDEFYKKGAKIG